VTLNYKQTVKLSTMLEDQEDETKTDGHHNATPEAHGDVAVVEERSVT
jgi:hypothetical protein